MQESTKILMRIQMKSPLSILHLEDDPLDAELVQTTLENEKICCKIERVDTKEQYIHALDQGSMDIILADFSLPSFTGLDALDLAKQKCPEIPFIFLSGILGEELAINSLKCGARDYVVKQRLSRLVPAVRRTMEEVEEKFVRKKAEKQLNRLASVVRQSSESILITDPDGNIEYVNPAYEKITGYSFSEVINKNPRILKSGKQDENFYHELWSTISSGNVWQGNFINKRKNGCIFYEKATIFPIKDEAGRIINYAAVKRDITGEIDLEQQLRQAQKLEGIGQLAGGIAHDFNNVLSIINGYSELALISGDTNNPLYGKISEISKASKRASELVRKLMIFSRDQVIETKIIHINELIIDLEKMLRRLIGEDIKIDVKLKKNVRQIKADPGQIEQVLINLIINGRDAINSKKSSNKKRIIKIITGNKTLSEKFILNHPGSKTGLYTTFEISDSGIGMDKEMRLKIFEPFYTTKPKGQGTGLGLSTVYGIVNQNNGYIEVKSVLGRGTTFNIYWPSINQTELSSEKQPAATRIPGGDEEILLVEDDEDVLNSSKTVLESLGYKVHSTACGRDALSIIKNEKIVPNLLITDVVMPEIGGMELAGEIKKIIEKIEVLYISGYTNCEIVRKNIIKTGAHFLSKPFSIHALAKKIREVLV
jgi:two-component system cell cycle sensor histidine kinase/response regulator CckA